MKRRDDNRQLRPVRGLLVVILCCCEFTWLQLQEEVEALDGAEAEEAGTFARASEEVLAQRKRIKIKRYSISGSMIQHSRMDTYIEKEKAVAPASPLMPPPITHSRISVV